MPGGDDSVANIPDEWECLYSLVKVRCSRDLEVEVNTIAECLCKCICLPWNVSTSDRCFKSDRRPAMSSYFPVGYGGEEKTLVDIKLRISCMDSSFVTFVSHDNERNSLESQPSDE
ncbi:hypothetical protein BaRGS_00005573 [Batillaria attramentaria]|uniref:Uncharacterized protein n=1 Tax=Batillaria attramentaria TaxID=370345 RepID=A0ABD0LVS8_9CAEN